MRVKNLLLVAGIFLPIGVALAATPIAPRGAFVSSSGGGKQVTKTFNTGSTFGDINLYFSAQTVADTLRAKNGRTRLFDLEFDDALGTFDRGTSYEGSSKTVTITVNPGGNPNPTTSWSYAVYFTLTNASLGYTDVLNVYDDLDAEVIPGVGSVQEMRDAVVELAKSVTAAGMSFPPKVKIVRNRLDSDQALILPAKNVDVDDLKAKSLKLIDSSNQARSAFNTMLRIRNNFDDIQDRLTEAENRISGLPGRLTAFGTVVTFLENHAPGREQRFKDIADAQSEKLTYEQNRDDASKGYLSEVKKVAILKRAAGIANDVMRKETKKTRKDRLEDVLALPRVERSVLDNSHSGILNRIR